MPRHDRHGGFVYPYFVLRALRQLGVHCQVIVPDGLTDLGFPFYYGEHVRVLGWATIGRLSISVSLFEWTLFVFRRFRSLWRQLFGTSASRFSRASSAGLLSELRASANEQMARKNGELNDYLLRQNADAIMVNMPYRLEFMSEELRAKKLVIVLTHDVIFERTKLFAENGWPLEMTPLTWDEEVGLLRKADVVIAISESDAAKFKQMVSEANVAVCLPPLYEGDAVGEREGNQWQGTDDALTCLFIGSGAAHNLATLRWLIRDLWPAAVCSMPSIKLRIVGNIAKSLSDMGELPKGLEAVGHVGDIAEAYRQADLSLSLVRHGSGVKIKILESVRFGVPAITTEEGLRGLPGCPHEVFPVVRGAADFAEAVRALAGSKEALRRQAQRQRQWAEANLTPSVLVHELVEIIRARSDRSL